MSAAAWRPHPRSTPLAKEPTALSALPEESFVPFVCHQLVKPQLVYVDAGQVEPEAVLREHAFVVRTETTAPAVHDASKVFWGERYGGEGLTKNGGGVRCGLAGGLQVKGIGANPLAGDGTSFWYSHGGCSLEEALVELVWGEVFSRILPHGAVRAPAIVDTGLSCFVKGKGGEKVAAPRALLLREAALRPAHFERAYAYKPSAQARTLWVHDTVRSAAAIERLPECLPSLRGLDAEVCSRLSRPERLNFGLQELALRFAEQLAATRAKRFMHGALTASNICLDGRFIDFGTASAFSCHANVVLGINAPFWGDHTHLSDVLGNLVFYCQKYLRGWAPAELPAAAPLGQLFGAALVGFSTVEFLKLSGLPTPNTPGELLPDQWQLGQALLALANADSRRPVDGIPDERTPLGVSLGHVLTVLATALTTDDADRRLLEAVPSGRCRSELVQLHWRIRQRLVAEGWCPNALRRHVVARAFKAGRSVNHLYRHRLTEWLRMLQRRHGTGAEFSVMFRRGLERLLLEVDLLHGAEDPSAGTPAMYRNQECDVRWQTSDGSWLISQSDGRKQSVAASVAQSEQELPPALFCARRYWGPEAWRGFT